jgi:hypothetical protein
MKDFKESIEWTVMIYAAGNNNLDSYLYRQITLIKESLKRTHMNIVVQLSREENLQLDSQDSEEEQGCCRYQIINNQTILIEDLGKISMAEPAVLNDFLVWATREFTSNRIMLIMSGHSAGFVGLMKEHSKTGFSIMGIKGFAKALRLFNKKTQKSINILVMDTCFMDLVEIWYQITTYAAKVVRYVLIPQNTTPLDGLPCHEMMITLNDAKTESSSDEVLAIIADRIGQSHFKNSRVFAIDLQGDNLLILKGLMTNLSKYLLDHHLEIKEIITLDGYYNETKDYINILYLFNLISQIDETVKIFAQKISEIVGQIIIYSSKEEAVITKNNGLKVFMPHNQRIYLKYRYQYKMLLFNYHSRWIEVLDEIYK